MKFCNANIGSNNGSATFTVTGFSSSLNCDILVSPLATETNVNDVITLTGLTANTYTTVTDRTTGCSKSDTVIIAEPTPIDFVATPTILCSR
jgi:hypothetical protein